jgi:hypothetical protein
VPLWSVPDLIYKPTYTGASKQGAVARIGSQTAPYIILFLTYYFFRIILDISICCVYAYPNLIDAMINGIAYVHHSGKTIA